MLKDRLKSASPEEVASLLVELVSIPSVNPSGIEPDGRVTGEGRLAQFVALKLEQFGARVKVEEVLPGRPNVVAEVGLEEGRTLLFETHLDTVPPEGEAGFTPRRKDEFLLGRGACDAKGAFCAMMLALRALTKVLPLPGRVILAAVADEEHSFKGVQRLIESGLKADGAVVGEPTRMKVVVGHKGTLRFKVVARGRAVHSSEPQRGENAIEKMAKFICEFAPRLRRKAESHIHPKVGGATVNIGVIRGGTRANVVPAYCEVEVERRVVPLESFDEVWEEVLRVAEEASRAAGVGVEVLPPHVRDPWLLTDEREPLVLSASRALGSLGLDGRPDYVAYSTDASKLSSAGTPNIVLGPGDPKLAHSAEEGVRLPWPLKHM